MDKNILNKPFKFAKRSGRSDYNFNTPQGLKLPILTA